MKIWLMVFLLGVVMPSVQADDKVYDAMKDFIQQEDGRLKDIKLLSLDLEKTDLEFKKREIEAKMAGLTGPTASDKDASSGSGLPDIRVSGIVIKDGVKHAFISVEGRPLYVREAQDIGNKMKIIKITDQFVSIKYPDGQEHQLELYGG